MLIPKRQMFLFFLSDQKFDRCFKHLPGHCARSKVVECFFNFESKCSHGDNVLLYATKQLAAVERFASRSCWYATLL